MLLVELDNPGVGCCMDVCGLAGCWGGEKGNVFEGIPVVAMDEIFAWQPECVRTLPTLVVSKQLSDVVRLLMGTVML